MKQQVTIVLTLAAKLTLSDIQAELEDEAWVESVEFVGPGVIVEGDD